VRLAASAGRRRLIAALIALVVTLGILSVLLPFVGGGGHGVSPIP
jgi:hypothetical protein